MATLTEPNAHPKHCTCAGKPSAGAAAAVVMVLRIYAFANTLTHAHTHTHADAQDGCEWVCVCGSLSGVCMQNAIQCV